MFSCKHYLTDPDRNLSEHLLGAEPVWNFEWAEKNP